MVGNFKEKRIEVLIIITIILSSMTGAEVLGISFTKIAIIPFEVYLLIKCHGVIRINKNQLILLIWYILTVASCVMGLLYKNSASGYGSKLMLYAIQIVFMYIPILLFVGKIPNLLDKLKKGLLITAYINCIWGLVQFFLWYFFKLDFNNWLFVDVLHGLFGSDWTVWNYETGNLAIRISGLCYDVAFFAIILVFGYCISENKVWKTVFFLAILLSMSRAGVVCVILIFIMRLLRANKHRIKSSTVIRSILFVVITMGVLWGIYQYSPSIRYQVDYLISRFSDINFNVGIGTGTSRHMMYIPAALEIWAVDFNIVRKLFGIGPRVGGVAIGNSESVTNLIRKTPSMYNTAWAIECDYAEVLLGQGIVGLLIYYILAKIYKKTDEKIRGCIISLFIMGIMYDFIALTVVQLFIIFISTAVAEDIKVTDSNAEQINPCVN